MPNIQLPKLPRLPLIPNEKLKEFVSNRVKFSIEPEKVEEPLVKFERPKVVEPSAPRVPELGFKGSIGAEVAKIAGIAARTIQTETFRSFATATISLRNRMSGSLRPTIDELKLDPQSTQFERTLYEALFGLERPLESISERAEKTTPRVANVLRNFNLPEVASEPLAWVAVLGTVGLDFTPWGTGKTGYKGFIKALQITEDVAESSKFLRTAGFAEDIIIEAAPKFAKLTDSKLIEEGVEQITKLQQTTRIAPRATRVPEELRKTIPVTVRRAEFVREPVTRITRTEPTLLKERIKNFTRGFREGRKLEATEIKSFQNELIQELKLLPIAERGKQTFIAGIKNATTEQKLVKESEKVAQTLNKIEEAQRLSKELGRFRSNIAFLRKIGEFNQGAINDVKRQLNIDKPVRQMTKTELDSVVTELSRRLRFKEVRGFVPEIPGVVAKEVKPPVIDEEVFRQNRLLRTDKIARKEFFTKEVGKRPSEIKRKVDQFLGVISTRLKNISNDLKIRLRKFEFDLRQVIKGDSEIARPYLEKVSKMSVDDFNDFDLALKNGSIEKVEQLLNKYDMKNEFNQVRKMLDNAWKRADEVGYDIGYLQNYFPRIIKDSEGFIRYLKNTDGWSLLEEAIKRKEMDLGRYLNTEEKASLINSMIRGYSGGRITLSKTGAMKERVIDFIGAELNQFYMDSNTALVRYIDEVNEAIEARRFFGKHLGGEIGKEQFNNIDDSIGAFITKELAEGKISPAQEFELREILTARFGNKGATGIIGTVKNLAYIDVLGNIENAVTQIGDLAFTFYKGGVKTGLSSTLRTIFGKVKITKEDLGFAARDIAAEFGDNDKIAKALDFIFKITGFTKIDRLGFESLIEATVTRGQRLALVPTDKFLDELRLVFPEKLFGETIIDDVIKELRSNQITDNVKFYAFNTLLDFSPRALSEVPARYLTSGDGRIFYMLKTWTLKMFDIYRNEVIQQFSIDKGQALRNMFRLSAALFVLNATADLIKDTITGRDIEIDDLVVDNLAKLVGFSRYTTTQIAREGLGQAIREQLVPPFPTLDNISKDVVSLFKDFEESASINELRTTQEIPIGGRLYYYWFGKGREIIERYDKPKREQGLFPELPTLPKLPKLPELPKF